MQPRSDVKDKPVGPGLACRLTIVGRDVRSAVSDGRKPSDPQSNLLRLLLYAQATVFVASVVIGRSAERTLVGNNRHERELRRRERRAVRRFVQVASAAYEFPASPPPAPSSPLFDI